MQEKKIKERERGGGRGGETSEREKGRKKGGRALTKGKQQPEMKPLPLLKPWQKTPGQKHMMRRRHEDPYPPRPFFGP